jgi:hypothetical protein
MQHSSPIIRHAKKAAGKLMPEYTGILPLKMRLIGRERERYQRTILHAKVYGFNALTFAGKHIVGISCYTLE